VLGLHISAFRSPTETIPSQARLKRPKGADILVRDETAPKGGGFVVFGFLEDVNEEGDDEQDAHNRPDESLTWHGLSFRGE
jgi:hypothetical protein